MLNWFVKKAVGLDVSDRSIEILELSRWGRRLTVSAAGRALLPAGAVIAGRIKDSKKLAATLAAARHGAAPRPITARAINFALPEALVYFHAVTILAEQQKNSSLATVAREQVERNFPVLSKDLVWAHRAILAGPGGTHLALAATSRPAAAEWHDFLRSQNLILNSFDLETVALARGLELSRDLKRKTRVLVDVGAATIMIAVFGEVGPLYSYQLQWGSEKLTREIATTFQLGRTADEEQKIKLGLSSTEPSLSLLLTRLLEPLLVELGETIKFIDQKFNQPIIEIVLAGGGGRLIGLPDYLNRNLHLPVRSAGLPAEIMVHRQLDSLMRGEQGLFVEAFGLARRGLELAAFERDLSLPVNF